MRTGRSSSSPQPRVTTARARSRRTSTSRLAFDLEGDRPGIGQRQRVGRHPAALIGNRDPRDARNGGQRGRGVGARRIDLHIHRRGALEAGGQVVGRVHRHDASLVDDDDALARLRDFRQDVRAEDDRVIPGQAPDEIARLDNLLGIETGGRLVENQHLGIVDERLREPHALAVPLRELPAVAGGHVGDARALHHRRHALLALPGRHPFDTRDEVEVLPDGHVGVERRRFREVAGPPLGVDRMIEHVEAGHHGAPFRRRHVAGQDAHGRGLSGAVRPQEPENFPPLHAKADVVHGGDAPVALADVLNLDHTVAPFPA